MTSLERYQKYRHLLRNGDILEWSGNSVVSKIIKWRTKSDVSHTSGVAWWMDRVFTLEASGMDFHPTALSHYMLRCKKKVYWLPLKPEFDKYRDSIVSVQLSLVGIKYDFGDLMKSLLGRVSTDLSYLFCSEAIGYSLEQVKAIKKQKHALWPGDFEDLGITQPRIRIF